MRMTGGCHEGDIKSQINPSIQVWTVWLSKDFNSNPTIRTFIQLVVQGYHLARQLSNTHYTSQVIIPSQCKVTTLQKFSLLCFHHPTTTTMQFWSALNKVLCDSSKLMFLLFLQRHIRAVIICNPIFFVVLSSTNKWLYGCVLYVVLYPNNNNDDKLRLKLCQAQVQLKLN